MRSAGHRNFPIRDPRKCLLDAIHKKKLDLTHLPGFNFRELIFLAQERAGRGFETKVLFQPSFRRFRAFPALRQTPSRNDTPGIGSLPYLPMSSLLREFSRPHKLTILMKPILPTCLQLAAVQLSLLLCATTQAAVTFSVTPAAVSNTYSGFITLQVTGLTNTEKVVIQKFLDVNTNGVIDGSDWLVQQFSLTDGQAGMVIGGINNSNVPGDTDSTAGQITAKLNFQNGDFVQNIAGRYRYKLSSPVGHFTPITNLFTVTNFPYPQKFAGNVVSNGTSTTVPNAVILLFPPARPGHNGPGGQPVVGAVANNSGSYSIPAPAGTYGLASFKSNYLANFATSPQVSLGAGATVTTNLSLLAATATISGKLVDADNPAIGLPGVLLPVQNTNQLIAVCTTDTNGNFTVRVQSGQWGVKDDNTSLIVHGYLSLQNAVMANAGDTGVTVAMPKATALVYGSVMDNLGNPMPGIAISADQQSTNLYQAGGYADPNGNYVAGVLGGQGSSYPWWVGVSSDTSPPNYVFSQPDFGTNNNGTNIAAGAAVQINFTAIAATNHISGNVNANSTNIVGVGVWASGLISGLNYQQSSVTDAGGNYSINVPNGAWDVGVSCNGGNQSLDNILGFANYTCPQSQPVPITNNNGVANFVIQPCTIQIATTNLPNGLVTASYDTFLQGWSCVGPLTWSLKDPMNFPPGLSLQSDGGIHGIPSTAGAYGFTVNANDSYGHVTNQNFSITINPKPTLTSPGWSANQFKMRINGAAGQNYTVQMSTNLGSTNWTVILVTNSPSANAFDVIDYGATGKQRFYRVLVGP
jgi:hypothetical protein